MMGKRQETVNIYKKKFKLSYTTPMVRFPLLIKNRDSTLNDVSKKDIYLGNWYVQPIAPNGLKLSTVEYTMGACPVAEAICKKIVNLPTLVSKDEAKRIIEYLWILKR